MSITINRTGSMGLLLKNSLLIAGLRLVEWPREPMEVSSESVENHLDAVRQRNRREFLRLDGVERIWIGGCR